jgi:hypothetical protein
MGIANKILFRKPDRKSLHGDVGMDGRIMLNFLNEFLTS